METIVINETIQQFNGVSYYLCDKYFQRKGKRLHRVVWEYHNGPIPKGYHVHHIDGNRANNQIENLTLMKAFDHLSKHMHQPERVEESREHIAIAQEYAKEWHKSEAGRAWHSQHGKEAVKHFRENAEPRTLVCAYCGKEFQTIYYNYGGKTGKRYCCNNHRHYAAIGKHYEDKSNKQSRES